MNSTRSLEFAKIDIWFKPPLYKNVAASVSVKVALKPGFDR